MITLKGDRLTVSLNGRVVIENAQLPGIPASGPHRPPASRQRHRFRQLWIKEL